MINFIAEKRLPIDSIKNLLLNSRPEEIAPINVLNNKLDRLLDSIKKMSVSVNLVIEKANVGNIETNSIMEVLNVIESLIPISEELIDTKKQVEVYSKTLTNQNFEGLLYDLDNIKIYQNSKKDIEDNQQIFKDAFGSLFTEFNTDWESIVLSLEWTERFKNVVGEIISENLVKIITTKDKAAQIKLKT